MEGVILIHDMQGEKISSGVFSAARRYVVGSSVNILRGELLLPIRGEITQHKDGKMPHNYYVKQDPTITLYCGEDDISPLNDDEFRLLEGIRSRVSRHDVFRGNKLEWASTLHTDCLVYATILGENVAKTECTTAVIRYVGPIGDQSGVQFGIEILDDQYRGLGTSDGIFQDDRYFTCEDKCGLFVSLEKISSEPTMPGTPVQQQSAPRSAKSSFADVTKSSGPAHNTRSREKLESSFDKLSKGQKVIAYDRKGNMCTGVVQWTGQLQDIPYTYVGIKTDKKVRPADFEHALTGNTQRLMSTGKGYSLVVPESLVTPVETSSKTDAPPKGPPQGDAQLGDSIASEFDMHSKLLREQEEVLREAEEVKRSNVERRVLQENNPELAQVKSAMESSVDIAQQQRMLQDCNIRRGSGDQRPLSQGGVPSQGLSSTQLPRQQSQRQDHIYDELKLNPATRHRLMNQGKSASVAEGEGVYDQYQKETYPAQQHPPQNFEQPSQYHQRLHEGNVQGFQPPQPQQPHQPPHPPLQGQHTHPNAQQQFSAVAGTGNAGVHPDLGFQSRIQIPSTEPEHVLRYGVIRWIGSVPEVQGLIAGIELDEEMEGCTDGTLQRTGQQFFSCAPAKGMYYPLSKLTPDERFSTQGANYYDNPLRDAPLEELEDQHISGGEVQRYVGDERGIQGHQNSCYLDATVFGLFALFDGFDDMFLTDSTDQQRRDISYILWKGIVNPLRKYGLVRFESVMKLRDKLEEFGKMKGITQDADPEDFLNMLFKHTLLVEPFISIKRPFGVEEEYFVQLFMEPDESLKLPSVGELLEKMFLEQDISFTEVPSKLLIQVPRFGKQFKTFDKILPGKSVNVAELMDVPPHQCFVCDKPAKKLCRQCQLNVCHPDSNEPPFFCDACWISFHDHSKRQGHVCEWCDEVKDLYQMSELELLSVICIETSHYVCFTRSEDKWVFFDSMANRVYDKFNIPKVADCTDVLSEWVYPADGDRSRLLNTPPRDLPEYVRRFTQDVYLCVYIQRDVGMYGCVGGTSHDFQRVPRNESKSLNEVQRLQQELSHEVIEKELLQRQLTEKDQERVALQQQLTEEKVLLQRQLAEKEEEKGSLQQQLTQKDQERVALQQQLTEEKESLQQQLVRERVLSGELDGRVQALQWQLEEAEHSSVRYTQLQVPSPAEDSWNVPRGQVEILEEIGRGGWGVILKGRFRDQMVAVKKAHREILKQSYTIRQLRREIQIMAHVQHPNLVRFVAAVIDEKVERGEETPLLVVELMHMDLRHAYNTINLGTNTTPIFRDVAYALHYLHEHQEPIIHRDVSAPNVLLQTLPGGLYRAKLSDFGSANKEKDSKTPGPGAICYTAPEVFPPVDLHAHMPPQTPKIDVFSYGILLTEVLTKTMPTTENRSQLVSNVQVGGDQPMYNLICSCTKYNPSDRPTMAGVLNTLNHIPIPRPRQTRILN